MIIRHKKIVMIYMITAERDLSAHNVGWTIKPANCQKGLMRNLGELSCVSLLNLFAEGWNTENCCKVQRRQFRHQEHNLKVSLRVFDPSLNSRRTKSPPGHISTLNVNMTLFFWFHDETRLQNSGRNMSRTGFIQRDSCRSRWPEGGPDPWETDTPFVKRQGGIHEEKRLKPKIIQ